MSQSSEVLPRGKGQPTKYDPEYCALLIEHCKKGNSLESFGSLVNCSKQTIYNWLKQFPDFLDARNKGMAFMSKYYEELGKAMATGRLTRMVSEEPVIGIDGKPVLDPNTREVMMRREFEPAQGSAAVFIFLTKNMLGWRDRRDFAVEWDALASTEPKTRTDTLSPEERMAEIQQMMKFLQEVQNDKPVIDITPVRA